MVKDNSKTVLIEELTPKYDTEVVQLWRDMMDEFSQSMKYEIAAQIFKKPLFYVTVILHSFFFFSIIDLDIWKSFFGGLSFSLIHELFRASVFYCIWKRKVCSLPPALKIASSFYSHSKRLFLVAVCENKAIGIVALNQTDDIETSEPRHLYVDPQFRKLGIAKRLLEVMIHTGVHVGFTRLILRTNKSNEGAILLYQKMGLTIEGKVTMFQTPLYLYPYEIEAIEMRLECLS